MSSMYNVKIIDRQIRSSYTGLKTYFFGKGSLI